MRHEALARREPWADEGKQYESDSLFPNERRWRRKALVLAEALFYLTILFCGHIV